MGMSFTTNGNYLASSGKDRRICIWKKKYEKQQPTYTLFFCKESAHKRIIWSIKFMDSPNNLQLASGSRDGFIKIWLLQQEKNYLKELFMFQPHTKPCVDKVMPITSLAFSFFSNLLAVGMECGWIEIWYIFSQEVAEQPKFVFKIPFHSCHSDSVTKLAWKPQEYVLASCSTDCGIRIFEFEMED